MRTIAELLERNRAWAAARTKSDPDFFNRLVDIQRPDYLWIGCSDSRVSANQIVNLNPGELFVHRNIANIVTAGESNCMAVVQYAIETLGVRHVIVCGHYRCGGVRAVLDNQFNGGFHVERWLSPLSQIALVHRSELDALTSHDERWNRLCEINVIEQIRRLTSSDVLTRAAAVGVDISAHGLIYSLKDGLLKELVAD